MPEEAAEPVASALGTRGVEVTPLEATGITGTVPLTWATGVELDDVRNGLLMTFGLERAYQAWHWVTVEVTIGRVTV